MSLPVHHTRPIQVPVQTSNVATVKTQHARIAGAAAVVRTLHQLNPERAPAVASRAEVHW